MKTTKWFSKILSSLLAMILIISSASFVSAKGSDKGKSEQKEHGQSQKDNQSTGTQDNKQSQKEDKSTNQKVENKDQEKKSTDKKADNKTKKEVTVKSKTGKTVDKRINSVESSISSITKSIDTYFGVNKDGTVDKELTKTTANKKYNSYKGKLKAEINKLRAYDKQLANYKKQNKITAAEYDAFLAKSKELQQLASDQIQRVKDIVVEATTPKTEDAATQPTAPAGTTPPTDPAAGTTPPTDPAAGTTPTTVPAAGTTPTTVPATPAL